MKKIEDPKVRRVVHFGTLSQKTGLKDFTAKKVEDKATLLSIP